MLTKQELIDFEEDIKKHFLNAEIRYPIHFSLGNEAALVGIFQKYDIANPDNWLFSTHRSHYHALLKGIPKEWLKEQIFHGNSMHIMSDKYKFMASSIVGGCLPIAVGVAWGIKKKNLKGKVFVFLGDMAASTGIFKECAIYAWCWKLPIMFIVEDNNLSTNTPTSETFNQYGWFHYYPLIQNVKEIATYYQYTRECPHINTKEWVEFR